MCSSDLTTAQGFMGLWDFTWEGPSGSGCPCSGTLAIGTDSQGQLIGRWDLKGAPARLTGSVGYDQNVWTGRFQQSDDVDFPLKGHFRLESRGDGLLTGDGVATGAGVAVLTGAGVAVGAEAAPVLGMADSMVKAGSGLPSALSRLKNRVCSQAGRQLSIDMSRPNTNIGPIHGQFLAAY